MVLCEGVCRRSFHVKCIPLIQGPPVTEDDYYCARCRQGKDMPPYTADATAPTEEQQCITAHRIFIDACAAANVAKKKRDGVERKRVGFYSKQAIPELSPAIQQCREILKKLLKHPHVCCLNHMCLVY